MRLTINGESMDAPQLATLAEVAAWLGLPTFGSAVELNGAVVRKADYASTEMKEGDRMEIVRLVGGG